MNTWHDTQFLLPTTVTLDGETLRIRNGCDYRVALDCFSALTDERLQPENRLLTALFIFYEDFDKIRDLPAAADKMTEILNGGRRSGGKHGSDRLMDWEHDFPLIAAPVSKALGYDVREPRTTHWWTFLSAYMEIGESVFATVVSIRKKRARGRKLEKWEREYAEENRDIVNLPTRESEKNIELLRQMEEGDEHGNEFR